MSERLPKELLYRFRDLIYERYGIHYIPTKIEILRNKLEKIQVREGNLADFYARVISGNKASEQALLKEITVGHTFFFREWAHLNLLIEDIERRKIIRPHIWCAASSTGEEPWSIAIAMLERGIRNFVIVASDVNVDSLRVMHRGSYHGGKFQSTPDHIRRRYFRDEGNDTFSVSPALRKYLKIKRLNLHDQIEFERQFDYVFCRNVMIYFDDAGRRKVIRNLVNNLQRGGLLFVGHTEALLELPPSLKKEAQSVFRRIP